MSDFADIPIIPIAAVEAIIEADEPPAADPLMAPLPADIEDALKDWRDTTDAMAAAGAEVERQIASLTDALGKIQAPYKSRITDLNALIVAQVLDRGTSITVANVRAEYRKGYPRITWDSKKLDGLALIVPEIISCRTVAQVQPGVTIKRI